VCAHMEMYAYIKWLYRSSICNYILW
jgi:hypothetical protein